MMMITCSELWWGRGIQLLWDNNQGPLWGVFNHDHDDHADDEADDDHADDDAVRQQPRTTASVINQDHHAYADSGDDDDFGDENHIGHDND